MRGPWRTRVMELRTLFQDEWGNSRNGDPLEIEVQCL